MITAEGVSGVTGGHFHTPYMILNGDPAKTVEVVSIDAKKEDTKNKLSKSKSELEKIVRKEYKNALEKLRSQKDSIQKQLLGKSKSLSQLGRVLSQKDVRIA